uniref:Carbohydrate kinase n=1 Tax=Fervidobacterium thailandense TaxID=1008305 RepID=A0A7C4RWR1_9BACT
MKVLSIDCGTQSLRAVIFSDKGEVLAKTNVEYDPPYISRGVDNAEQDPEFYWKALCKATKKLRQDAPSHFSEIEGVSLTTQRSTVVVLDKYGKPVRNAVLWLDQRLAPGRPNFKFWENLAFSIIGMKDAAHKAWRRSLANYMRVKEPELWRRVDKYLLLSGYLNYKLTGLFVDSVASQVGYIPFDYKHFRWYENLHHYKWRMFGIERHMLPSLVEPTTVIGHITREASGETGLPEGLPVIASGADKMCETLAVGCLSPEVASISLGTTATIETTTNKYIEVIPFMPPYPSLIPGKYTPEVAIFRGYWLLSWFKREFAAHEVREAERLGISAEELLNQRLKSIPPGSEGLIVHPTWTPGLDKAFSRGAIVGFSDKHSRIHVYRALIEGINFGLMEGLELIQRKTRIPVKKIGLSGGGALSDEICQITADMFGVTTYKIQTHDTSALGAAIACLVGLKRFKTFEEAVRNMVHVSSEFIPNRENHVRYDKIYNRIYKKLWRSMNGLYGELRKLETK